MNIDNALTSIPFIFSILILFLDKGIRNFSRNKINDSSIFGKIFTKRYDLIIVLILPLVMLSSMVQSRSSSKKEMVSLQNQLLIPVNSSSP